MGKKTGVRQQEGEDVLKNTKQNSACSLTTEEKESRIMSKITEPWVQATHTRLLTHTHIHTSIHTYSHPGAHALPRASLPSVRA